MSIYEILASNGEVGRLIRSFLLWQHIEDKQVNSLNFVHLGCWLSCFIVVLYIPFSSQVLTLPDKYFSSFVSQEKAVCFYLLRMCIRIRIRISITLCRCKWRSSPSSCTSSSCRPWRCSSTPYRPSSLLFRSLWGTFRFVAYFSRKPKTTRRLGEILVTTANSPTAPIYTGTDPVPPSIASSQAKLKP